MDELNPIYRIEFFLDAIVNSTTPPEPIYRVEFYLAKIAGADVEIPEPVYRMEKYLAYLCGEEVELPDPIYRIEYYLAFLCGLNVAIPEPIYRVEFWLWDWCGGGGIEKTVTGNPIHITDAIAKPVQGLSVALEPIQDLHGYDAPWPAGGGKNKFDPAEAQNNKWINGTTGEIESVSGFWVTGFIPVKSGDVIRSALKGSARNAWYNADKSQATYFAFNGEGSATAPSDGFVVLAVSSSTVAYGSDFIVTINNADLAYSPYSNICPISGHTDADVTRTGKNLLDPTYRSNLTANIRFHYNTTGFLLKANTAYTFSVSSPSAQNTILEIGGSQLTANYGKTSITYTPTKDVYVWIDAYYAGNYPAPSGGTEAVNCQLELGSTATDYEEYRGTTYPIPLGQTVYGGTLDVLTGVLTVDRAIADLGTLEWSLHSNTATRQAWVGYGLYFKGAPDGNTPINAICDIAKTVSYNATWKPFTISTNTATTGTALIFSVEPSQYASAADFKAAMSGVQLCYELATPTTIQLTPTQVELLLGENNIWSDGEMTLVYLADGNASDIEALNILLGNRYVNNHGEDEPTDREALDILLGR